MKKTPLTFLCASLAAISIFSTSCNAVKDAIPPIDISLTSRDVAFDVPASAAGQQSTTAIIAFDLANEIKLQNTSGVNVDVSNIKTAKIKALSADITSGQSTTNNFANFQDVSLSLATNASTATQAKTVVGQVTGNPDVYTTHLEIPITGTTDLTEYIKGTSFTYTYSYLLRRATNAPLHVVFHVQYEITVKP
jgi:hypothetical protein